MIRRAFLTLGVLSALAACGSSQIADLPGDGDGPGDPPATSQTGSTHVSPATGTELTALPGPESGPLVPDTWTYPPLQTSVETYELQIPEATLKLFADDKYAEEQPATFVYQGQSYPVHVRLRGASARDFPKRSWNVDFDNLRFQGREELNLVAEYQDQTMLVEQIAYDMLRAMGVPAPNTKFVRVMLNGKYEGLYLDIEEVDKKFLKAHRMPDEDASIYRAGAWDGETKTWTQPWQGEWDKHSNKSEPNDDLTAFLEMVNYTPEPEFPAELRKNLEVENFLRIMAMEAIFSHDYVEDARSYYISDRVTHRWYVVPWDLNNADPRWWPTYSLDMWPVTDHPLYSFTLQDAWLQRIYDIRKNEAPGYEPTFDNLRSRILNNPELRKDLLARTERAWKELLDPAVLNPRLEQLHAFIEPYVRADPYMDQAKFDRGLWFVQEFVRERYDFVRSELDRLENQKPGLVISAFDPAEGWVQLQNLGDKPVSTQGLVLTNYLRRAVVPSNVPTRTLAPGEKLVLTEQQLKVNFDSKGEVGLFNGKSVAGVIDFLLYGPVPAGKRYVRDDHANWQVQ